MSGFGISSLLLVLVIIFLPLAFLPTIIALSKNHPYKIPIVLINIFGGLLWGVGWLIALIWCFIVPEEKVVSIAILQNTANVADELDKLNSLKERGVISEDEFNTKKQELMQL